MSDPLVSVVIPSYNAEPFLRATLDSVFAQTFVNFEVLVIDDASTDGTQTLLQEYSDPRLVVHRNPANLGIAGTRNRGIALSRGKYLAWLDADDVATPERLARQVAFLEGYPEFLLCCGNVRSMDRSGRLISGPWWGRRNRVPQEWELCWTNPVAQSTVMVRRGALLGLTEGYSALHVPAEDYHLWTRLVLEGRVHRLPQVLVHYRILEGSAFHSKRDHAMAMSLKSSEALVSALTGGVPAFHHRLTSFAWRPDTREARLEFPAVLGWMERVLATVEKQSCWSPKEALRARRDLRRRLFRTFFAPESPPPSSEALGWLLARGPGWPLLLLFKTVVRHVRRGRGA